jgi:hypothetical protein
MSRLSRQSRILNIPLVYRPPRPVTEMQCFTLLNGYYLVLMRRNELVAYTEDEHGTRYRNPLSEGEGDKSVPQTVLV